MSKRIRTTISLHPEVYDSLSELGLFENREISKLANELFLEYVQNYHLNNLESHSKNFIATSVQEAFAKAFARQDTKLNHIYQTTLFNAYLALRNVEDLTDEELEEERRRTKLELDKLTANMKYIEKYMTDRPKPKVKPRGPSELKSTMEEERPPTSNHIINNNDVEMIQERLDSEDESLIDLTQLIEN